MSSLSTSNMRSPLRSGSPAYTIGTRPPSGSKKRPPLKKEGSSFEVLDPGQEEIVPRKTSSAGSSGRSSRLSDGGERRGSAGARIQRSDSASKIRSPTPTKQISLQTAKKKEDDQDVSYGELDWNEHEQLTQMMLDSKQKSSGDLAKEMNRLNITDSAPGESSGAPSTITTELSSGETVNQDEDAEENEEGEESEEEEPKAPNELMMEFLDCVMQEDYETADKLCKMILMYEPTNPEALQFKPLIEEARTQAAEEGEESGSEDGSDDDEDEGEDEEEDSNTDSTSGSSSEDSEGESGDR